MPGTMQTVSWFSQDTVNGILEVRPHPRQAFKSSVERPERLSSEVTSKDTDVVAYAREKLN